MLNIEFGWNVEFRIWNMEWVQGAVARSATAPFYILYSSLLL